MKHSWENAKFDPLWKKYNFKRKDCYGWLASKLGLMMRETHYKSLEILENIDFKDVWEYVKNRKSDK